MKILLLAIFGIIVLSIAACSKGTMEKMPSAEAPPKPLAMSKIKNLTFHGNMRKPEKPLDPPGVAALKNNHLDVSPTKTIGEAFDAYKHAIKKEWMETSTKSGPFYIDFICWFTINPVSTPALKEGVVKRGLNIKFAVQEDGETYIAMASRIDVKSDGMLYTIPLSTSEIKKNVTAIYENREITF